MENYSCRVIKHGDVYVHWYYSNISKFIILVITLFITRKQYKTHICMLRGHHTLVTVNFEGKICEFHLQPIIQAQVESNENHKLWTIYN